MARPEAIPDEEDWRGPVDRARWLRGASITDWMPGPLSPLFASTFVPEAERVLQDLCRELHIPIPSPFLAVIGGRLYLRCDSFLGWDLLLAPIAYLRFTMSLERRWRREWLPELQSTASRWDHDVRSFADDELLRGIDELARAGARYWRAAYLPRVAGLPEQLFTSYYRLAAAADDPHGSVLLGGTLDPAAAVAASTAPHLDFVHPTASELRASPDAPEPRASVAEPAQVAARRVRTRFGPPGRLLFRWLWRWARHWVVLREESMLSMGHPWPALRRLVGEWEARHGVPAGLGYFLTRAELEACPGDAATLAAERSDRWVRRRYARAPLMLPAPFRILGLDLRRFLAGGRAGTDDGVIRGVGVSPGTATGAACVVFSPDELDRMVDGGILVAPLTNPAWLPVLSLASAIVTDTGGPLSHASIVAREFGIPAVVGTGDATALLADGLRVVVDGDAGTVVVTPAD